MTLQFEAFIYVSSYILQEIILQDIRHWGNVIAHFIFQYSVCKADVFLKCSIFHLQFVQLIQSIHLMCRLKDLNFVCDFLNEIKKWKDLDRNIQNQTVLWCNHNIDWPGLLPLASTNQIYIFCKHWYFPYSSQLFFLNRCFFLQWVCSTILYSYCG